MPAEGDNGIPLKMQQPDQSGWYSYYGNIHMHTTYSDGVGQYDDLVAAAYAAGLDFIYVTDHNVLVRDREEGYRRGVLTLVGEEAHDDDRVPQRNHLLCLGISTDLADQTKEPQKLINAVNRQQGLAFLAHPFEEVTALAPQHWGWENWEVTDYTGIEIWNYMSVFRGFTTSTARSVLMGYFPHWHLRGPLAVTLQKWDELTQQRAVVGIGGTDVHAWTYKIGPLRRVFLPYLHCAQALNTHILTEQPLLGSALDVDHQAAAVQHDHRLVLDALQRGHCWTGYDLAGPTAGFRFAAWQVVKQEQPRAELPPHAIMGDTLERPPSGKSTFFRVKTPAVAHIRLLRNGQLVCQRSANLLEYSSSEPGVYRVEVWRWRWGRPRGWIFSNPIYVR